MNLARLWNLPVIYVCENNLYNEYTHFSETTAGEILARPRGIRNSGGECGRAGYSRRTRRGKQRVDRAGAAQEKGPSFLLCNTYRYHGHHVGDVNREYYRAKQEEQQWKAERDPIKAA